MMDNKRAIELLGDLIGFEEELIDIKNEYNIPWYVEDINASDYDEALKMAIKALEQEPFINKPCVSTEACKYDKNKVLDKLRADIEGTTPTYHNPDWSITDLVPISEVLKLIDKYKEESEDSSSISSKKAVNSIFGLPSTITVHANAGKLTNGDMMKIFFPDIEIETVKMDDKIIGYGISKLDKLTYFTKGWWDAPYFVESEETNADSN